MAVRKQRYLNLLFFFSLFILVFFAVALLSYSAKDPSFSNIIFTDYEENVHNLFGKFGAYTADMLGALFGAPALLLPLLMVNVVLQLHALRKRILLTWHTPLITLALTLLIVIDLSILQGVISEKDFYFPGKPAGGLFGVISTTVIQSLIGGFGTVFISVLVFIAGLLLYFAVTVDQAMNRTRAFLLSLMRKKPIKPFSLGAFAARLRKIMPVRSGDADELPAEKDEPEAPETEFDDDDDIQLFAPAKKVEKAPELPKPAPAPIKAEPKPEPAPEPKPAPKAEETEEYEIKEKEQVKKAARSKYTVPMRLLDPAPPHMAGEEEKDLRAKADMLVAKLNDFGVEGRVREIRPGPVVTLFEFEPAPGIKISKIANLGDDLALAMSALSVRIIAPIPGKAAVGVEIPNKKRETVYLSELLQSEEFAQNESNLAIALGKDVSGRAYVSSLDKMPHLLVAGTTGSGKSVSVNTMICSILFKSSPDLVKFVMIDPKMVELSVYEGIPHLAAPVVIDPRQAAHVLKNVVTEMEERYSALASKRVRSLESFNELAKSDPEIEPMPFLVVIVDEFADLMMVAGKEVEQSIIRIAQMARAVGIHLVLATQRPSVNVITGIIKANMPSRLSFKVSSKIDSRTVLDQNGAEFLLGRGDSLFLPSGSGDAVRIHGCFVSEQEVNRIVDHLKTLGTPEYNMDLVKTDSTALDEIDESELDDKYQQALDLVKEKGFASISMIQRYLRIGYNRAARIVEIMEKQGIIAPSDGTSKPRELLIKD